MTFEDKLKKVIAEGVFAQVVRVSTGEMSAATLTFAGTPNENLLVAEGLRRRDPDLLDSLILQYQRRLLRYLLYLTGNRELAEDLFQETWMRVLLRGEQFKGNARFDTWLFTIARNLVIDMRRRRTTISLDAMNDPAGEERAFEVAADEPSPFDLYRSQERAEALAEALLTLEALQREVLVLRFHEDLSLEEIAKVTSAPLSTVKSRLYRGLAALKPRVALSCEAGASGGGR